MPWGDGVWTAVIPGTALAAGEMTRWRFVAADLDGTKTKEPAYRARLDSHQYFGTVAKDSGIRTSLSVLHWFTKNVSAAGSSSGSRGAVYYNGEFYDNVFCLPGMDNPRPVFRRRVTTSISIVRNDFAGTQTNREWPILI